MATKKKTKKKLTKSKPRTTKKASGRKPEKKKKKPSRKAVARKPNLGSRRTTATKKKTGKKRSGRETLARVKKPAVGEERGPDSTAFLRQPPHFRSGEQSGDLQGLSRRERVGSESVDELMEEGNAFEAEIVQGVEDAGDEEGREVRTHEVSEDDIPEEYLDRDKD